MNAIAVCELEGREEYLIVKSDLVLQDLAPDVNLTCITEHPGFQPFVFRSGV